MFLQYVQYLFSIEYTVSYVCLSDTGTEYRHRYLLTLYRYSIINSLTWNSALC